jgi:hypothetical protein
MPEEWQADVKRLVTSWSDTALASVDAENPPAALAEWCRDQGAEQLVTSEDLPEVLGACVGLPGTLAMVGDTDAFLRSVADRMSAGGRLVIAVSFAVASPSGAVRAFLPTRLIERATALFAVHAVDITDNMFGMVAVAESDRAQRHQAADRAKVAVAALLEERIARLWVAQQRGEHLGAAIPGLEQAVMDSDQAHFVTRGQRTTLRAERNVARAERDTLKAERNAAHAERDTLKAERIDLLATIGEQATQHKRDDDRISDLERRLRRIESSRWWQLRGVVAELRRNPRAGAALPKRLWRLLRGAK